MNRGAVNAPHRQRRAAVRTEGSSLEDGTIASRAGPRADLRREADPLKHWKINEEDWRNRAKWDRYQEAVEDMLLHTSTSYAPWTVVEAQNKYYARVKVVKTIVDAIEKRLN